MAAFEELGMMPELICAVEEMQWLLPTPVQQEAIPLIITGSDVLAAAETGSGKTGAFALPILQYEMTEQIVQEALREKDLQTTNQDTHITVRLSDDDRDPMMALAESGMLCESSARKLWAGVRANTASIAGRLYWEATVLTDGLARVGFSMGLCSLDLGIDWGSFGYGGTGNKSHGGEFESYGEPFGKGDVIGCIIDCDNLALSFTKNGRDLGIAFQFPQNLRNQGMFPTLSIKNATVRVSFERQSMKFMPTDGVVPFSEAPPECLRQRGLGPCSRSERSSHFPLALILEPARDLAEQTHDNIVLFSKHLFNPSVRAALLVGGDDYNKQRQALAQGVEIITGTAGRIMDMIESGSLFLDHVRFFVLDEADTLLDIGNRDSIHRIFRLIPKMGGGRKDRRLQTLLFSATLHSPEIKELVSELCENPVWIDLKGKNAVPETVDHVILRANPFEDRSWLQQDPKVDTDGCHSFDKAPTPQLLDDAAVSEAIKRLKPRLLIRIIDAFEMDQAIVFCRTNFDCDLLERFLNQVGGGSGQRFRGAMESMRENPYSCAVLGGARSMDQRRKNLDAFKEGTVRFLICTDVATRGLDIPNLPYVINMTLPEKAENYIHRIGRVGRADRYGLAISIVAKPKEKVWYCSKKGYKPWLNPTPTDIQRHTIWYDEDKCLQDVENRIGSKIDELGPGLVLPSAILSKHATSGIPVYGGEKGAQSDSQLAKERIQLQNLGPALSTLAELEVQAQVSYFHLQTHWAQR